MSESLDDLISKLSEKRKEVPIGSLWRHIKTDNLYIVKDIVVVESDLTFAVSYQKLGDFSRLRWLRPLDEFLDGRFKREVLFKDAVENGSNSGR